MNRDQRPHGKNIVAGFTLLEVTVVVLLIGILAAAGIGTYNEVREQARDTQRATALKQLQIAIEAYKEVYGKYPDKNLSCGTRSWHGPGPNTATWGDECADYIPGLVPEFIPALPMDPKFEFEPGKGFIYRTNATSSEYKVLVHGTVETDLVTSYDHELARCPRSCLAENPGNNYCNTTTGQNPQTDVYAIYSAGAKCW